MPVRILIAEDAGQYRDLRLQALTTNSEAFATTYEDYAARSNEQVASQLAPDDHHFTLGTFEDNGSRKLMGIVTLVREQALKAAHCECGRHVRITGCSPARRREKVACRPHRTGPADRRIGATEIMRGPRKLRSDRSVSFRGVSDIWCRTECIENRRSFVE